jgi:predicted membrane chloride channel (bestrophin family)
MIKVFRRITLIINLKAILVTTAAVLSTFLCGRFEMTADLPLTIVATAVIFPIVFSISGAYKRRENALHHYGVLKAHGRSIFFAVRDWLQDPEDEVLDRVKALLGDLLAACRELFVRPHEELEKNEEAVYAQFSRLSRFIRDDMRNNGMASGEVSRCNQFLSKMMIAFEATKHVYQYRTPRTLRAFSDFFIVVLPIAYGPHFARMAEDSSAGLHYIVPVLFSIILVSLDNIQDHLENPFDQIGEDDVTINVEKFLRRLEL